MKITKHRHLSRACLPVVPHADGIEYLERYQTPLQFLHHRLALRVSAQPLIVIENVFFHCFSFVHLGVMALRWGFNICERLGEERLVLSITRISTGRFGHLMCIL